MAKMFSFPVFMRSPTPGSDLIPLAMLIRFQRSDCLCGACGTFLPRDWVMYVINMMHVVEMMQMMKVM
jgi:hypothetical protein